MGTEDDMTAEEKRHDQLTAAPDATEDDAKPRIVVSDHDGVTRIDIADDAPVRPGDPTKDPREN
ncbi:multidrug transporter [Microbacterium sp. NPDC096154]|uniref:multidrug transporter n=1 Tax=Microbacterium sp. NPDC096154 TaxID=3155549 RepID=UPI0033333544